MPTSCIIISKSGLRNLCRPFAPRARNSRNRTGWDCLGLVSLQVFLGFWKFSHTKPPQINVLCLDEETVATNKTSFSESLVLLLIITNRLRDIKFLYLQPVNSPNKVLPVFTIILNICLQIKSGFSKGLEAALDDYKEKGFRDAWDGLQSKVWFTCFINSDIVHLR